MDAADPVTPGRRWAEALGRVVLDDPPDEYGIRPERNRLPGLVRVPVPDERTVQNRLPWISGPTTRRRRPSGSSPSVPARRTSARASSRGGPSPPRERRVPRALLAPCPSLAPAARDAWFEPPMDRLPVVFPWRRVPDGDTRSPVPPALIAGAPTTSRGAGMTSDQAIDPGAVPSGAGCSDCDAVGGWWFPLRRCARCGHAGCCDSSPRRTSKPPGIPWSAATNPARPGSGTTPRKSCTSRART